MLRCSVKMQSLEKTIDRSPAMSSYIRASVLSLGLIAGAAFAAQAQTAGEQSSLPPGGGAVPSIIMPDGHYPGPNPGSSSYIPSTPRVAAVAPSGAYVGPATGATNGPMPPHFAKPAGYDHDPSLAPYTSTGMGPKTN
jgi:hypothetical protein